MFKQPRGRQEKNRDKKEGGKVQLERKYKMVSLSPNISIITLDANDLTIPTENQRVADWIKYMTQPCAIYKKLISNVMLKTD